MALVTLCAVFILLAASVRRTGSFTCINNKKYPVDWFIVYVLPRNANVQSVAITRGNAFLYLDAHTKKWVLPPLTLSDRAQAVGYTLQPFYEDADNTKNFAIFYNNDAPEEDTPSWSSPVPKDRPPSGPGVVLNDGRKTVWMVHSVPCFPSACQYEAPSIDKANLILCMSLSGRNSLNDLAKLLFYAEPNIYAYTVKSPLVQNKVVSKLINRKAIGTLLFPSKRAIHLTVGKQDVTAFAKLHLTNDDIYYGYVTGIMAGILGSYRNCLFVYTGNCAENSHLLNSTCELPSATGNFESDCKPLILRTRASCTKVKITNAGDNSNWALAYHTPYWCFSDLPRTPDQLKMSGSAVCFTGDSFPNLVDGFKELVPRERKSCAS